MRFQGVRGLGRRVFSFGLTISGVACCGAGNAPGALML